MQKRYLYFLVAFICILTIGLFIYTKKPDDLALPEKFQVSFKEHKQPLEIAQVVEEPLPILESEPSKVTVFAKNHSNKKPIEVIDADNPLAQISQLPENEERTESEFVGANNFLAQTTLLEAEDKPTQKTEVEFINADEYFAQKDKSRQTHK